MCDARETVITAGGRVLVFDDEMKLAVFTVHLWCGVSREAVRARGRMTAALSGGRTPVAFLRLLAEAGRGLPWSAIHIFQVDERFVPADHEESNYRMIKGALLDRVPIPSRNVHRMRTDLADPDAAARRYEEELIGFFALKAGAVPPFDLVLLGLGEDGHTASLFPGSPFLDDRTRLAGAVTFDGDRAARVTLTPRAINGGRHVRFLVAGRQKAAILRKAADESDPALPFSRIRPAAGDLAFLADKAAAALLEGRTRK